jgi:CheY-like chemotaxis protein
MITQGRMTRMAKRILIIEDVDHLREMLKVTLEFRGYEVLEAGDGSAGLDCIEKEGPFDLVFCDIEMPVMNGIEFIRNFRDMDKQTPVIMLTAEEGDAIQQTLALGANMYIQKPFEPIYLINRVEELT